MKHIRLLVAIMAVVAGLGVLAPSTALAADTKASNKTSAKTTVCTTLGSSDDCTTTPSGSVSINSIITAVVNILSIVIGVVAVIMVMVGGFRYVTSGGDSNSISSAKNTILYAIVGIIVAALAQVIVNFVLKKIT